MEILYVKNQAIDKQRWDATIEADPKGLPYAYSWYLDKATSGNWDALITPDYEFLLPLPWNRKIFGLHQIYAPLLTQQLGIAGPNLSEIITLNFFN